MRPQPEIWYRYKGFFHYRVVRWQGLVYPLVGALLTHGINIGGLSGEQS